MEKTDKIYVAGHRGMVGSAIVRKLQQEGYDNLVLRTSAELDLRNQEATDRFFKEQKPDYVFLSAAKVGGIVANNTFRAEFLYDNLMIQNNVIHSAYVNGVTKLMFLGSSCIYPKLAPQPLKEDYLLTGPLEPTNEWYAVAKITGVKACEAIRKQFGKDYISLMPTNLYGPFDNFDLTTSHVLPAMIRKFHDAKVRSEQNYTSVPEHVEGVELWGSGTPMREFLYVEDLALAVVFALENKFQDNLYNVGTGEDLTIKELAEMIQKIVGHTGEIHWDSSKPDGTPRKLMDVSKMTSAGWKAKTSLEDGIRKTYEWFLQHQGEFKEVKID